MLRRAAARRTGVRRQVGENPIESASQSASELFDFTLRDDQGRRHYETAGKGTHDNAGLEPRLVNRFAQTPNLEAGRRASALLTGYGHVKRTHQPKFAVARDERMIKETVKHPVPIRDHASDVSEDVAALEDVQHLDRDGGRDSMG